jgi:rhodanese-related sulfurtransferase
MTMQTLLAFASDHLVLSLAFVGLSLALIYTEVARLFSGFKSVSPAQLTALINRDDALLIDLSASADFEKGHIAGARNLAMSQFDPENKLLAKAKDLPVAVTCRTGMTSADAAKRLVKAGFTSVSWLDGGVQAWQQAGLPLVKGRG